MKHPVWFGHARRVRALPHLTLRLYGTGSNARSGITLVRKAARHVPASGMMSVVQHQPTGAAFDLVLLLHTAAAAVALVSTVTTAATGTRLRRVLHWNRSAA